MKPNKPIRASTRKQLSDAFECALTGHPIEWKGNAARRIWNKYIVKRPKDGK